MMQQQAIYSMTGFGRAEKPIGEYQVQVEMKSLNGKQFDCNLKIPPLLKPYEFDIRNLITRKLQRGSIDAMITLKMNGTQKPAAINRDLLKAYYDSVVDLFEGEKLQPGEVIGALLRVPDVVMPLNDMLDESFWPEVAALVESACDDLMVHRAEEGAALKEDIESRISRIQSHASQVEELAPRRATRIRETIARKLEEWVGKENVDENRFEQEIIYYLEKLDITEELTRLRNHCTYFFSILAESDLGKGKKLGFLLQEIGREINTTGSKANDADIQKLVVEMKDDLEKAKEQTLNLL